MMQTWILWKKEEKIQNMAMVEDRKNKGKGKIKNEDFLKKIKEDGKILKNTRTREDNWILVLDNWIVYSNCGK